VIAIHLGGHQDYGAVHALQERWVAALAEGRVDDCVLLLEHAPVITIGRGRGGRDGVAAPTEAPVLEVERGGQATWHGPGQLVAYPIVKLEGAGRDLHAHLRALEEAVIDVLAGLGLTGVRDARNSGVWLPCPPGSPRKVCSVGIACRRWVTWHGLALNVAPDRTAFAAIRPCGMDAEVMTRIADHISTAPSVDSLRDPLVHALGRRLGRRVTDRREVSDPTTLLA
jgi:lipoate-protein ligase B